MSSNPPLSIRLRLEDVIALAFFLINLGVHLVFRGLERHSLSPADVLIIIPAVALLMAKELVQYFWAGGEHTLAPSGAPWSFARPYWQIFRDWFPFFVILLMYYSLWGDSTRLMITHDRDSALIALDQRFFGFQASVAMQRWVSPPLTAWMDFAYFYHLLNIPVVACFIYLRRPRKQFRETMTGLIVVCFFGFLGYLAVPAIGPMYTLRDQYTLSLDTPVALFNRQVEFMDFARIQRDVFPSMHVAISFLMWLYAYRNSRRLFWFLLPLVLSLWASTIYLRYHYLVDVAAGMMLAPLCFWLSNFLFARREEITLRLALPASWGTRLRWAQSPPPDEGAGGKLQERP